MNAERHAFGLSTHQRCGYSVSPPSQAHPNHPMKHLIPAALLLAAHALSQAASLPAEVLGTWGLSEAAADLVAPNCRSLTYRFDATTVTETHGEMVLKTKYEIEGEGPPLSLRLVVTEYNARPNCIGTLLPFAVGQQIPNLRIELRGDRLRLHLRERRGGSRHVDLVRSPDRPARP